MILQPGSRPVPKYPDYVRIRRLGAGAFGEVWHAHGPGGLDVALKFMRVDAHGLARELRSLEAVKSIRHPNLVCLFGICHKDNWLILAMELCDGTLQDRLGEVLYQNQPGVPPDELLNYMSDAANGLDALSAKQVLHRDVKPANLLLLNSAVKVADYGLARVLEKTVASNSGAGTLAYTAPECFKGKLTQQSDQYSLAVTYYHLRTGHLLFEGDQAQMMYGHLELEPNLWRLPPAEQVVLARALSKEPGNRWRGCKTFVCELITAHRRAKEREHQSEEAELKQQTQECQVNEPEPRVAKHKEESEHKISTPASLAREPCWFCKRNKPIGVPVTIKLFLTQPGGSDSEALCNVPRCRSCQHRHVITHLFFWGPTAIGVFNFFCLFPSALDWVWQGWPWISGPGLALAGLFWCYFWRQRWLKNRVADFPEVKARLAAGWRL